MEASEIVGPDAILAEAKRLAEELEGKRERVRLRGGKTETIGVPLTANERAWLLVYLNA